MWIYFIMSAMLILGNLGCGTDLPTSGRDIWGRDEETLELIPVGSTLSEIVADPRRPYLYAADFDNSLLYIISSTSRQIEKRLALGSRPSDLALSMDGNLLYVALLGGDEVAVVDLDLQEGVDRIPLSFSPGYLVAGRPPYIYVTSSLDLELSFTDDGETHVINTETHAVEKMIPPVGLLEIDAARTRFYIAVLDRIYQYNITDDLARYRGQVTTPGPVVEIHLSADGSRLYSISAGPLVAATDIVAEGLISSWANIDQNRVEVFDTGSFTKVGELHTRAFPRAIAASGEYIAVAASDSLRSTHSTGFVVTYDATTLKTASTHRLVGVPTGCAEVDLATGIFYVAVDNPYDLRDRFGTRQDLQIVPLHTTLPDGREGGIPALPATDAASPGEITVALSGGVTMDMMWIEPGSFMMGSHEMMVEMIPNEGPRHEVTITRGFYLGKYEFTQGQWTAVMGTEPWQGQSYMVPHPDHPAVYISWDDVQDLVHRLNEVEGEEVYRMPTEAEWEYACRAGTTTEYSFGNRAGLLGDYGWYQANTWSDGEPYAHPVGALLPNPWGLYDMHGNIWEWVEDWLGGYPEGAQTDPVGPATGVYRVVRSGIFMAGPMGHRSAFRYGGAQDFPDGGVGVRLVRLKP